ncbi:hypothetical protein DNK06_20630 [Pseudomonas daroniae]|uniref:Uncharacterized protein n=1 Tax=Phytopseudomonas daroniae TaxID=2487519 RepID=A0A4Q9QI15_9GAMM|nr:hypothetical protein DNK06_20630 [Pseudomonas daroniae]TBU79175.1 hypothetical protein DNK31_19880 [Pseudomonas sp. FRB 228]TBU88073.1 hypothetical protein DNJ99_20105 [Pseudomonas daroniae]
MSDRSVFWSWSALLTPGQGRLVSRCDRGGERGIVMWDGSQVAVAACRRVDDALSVHRSAIAMVDEKSVIHPTG